MKPMPLCGMSELACQIKNPNQARRRENAFIDHEEA